MEVDLEIVPKLGFLLDRPMRHKVAVGGRGKGASWSFARAILARGLDRPLRVLCCREIQENINDSVHRLLADQIDALGLQSRYDVLSTEIRGANGTTIGYAGLKHNIRGLKSWEGADICWVSEAAGVSRASWNTLTPTIRKDNSEIWIDLNPELETDETYQRFVIDPPADTIVCRLTWRDNPWFNDVLRAEKDDLQARNPVDYDNVWEGMPRSTLAEAIYAEEMMAAAREGRICKVPYDPTCAVHTFWDLGFGNHTSIWIGQRVGVEWRMLRFIEDANKFLPYYVSEIKKLNYMWGTDYLPHDGASKHVQGDSAEQQLTKAGRIVECLTNDGIDTGINAARAVFPFVYFDREGCADGIQHLRHYRWKRSNDGVVMSREPLHDEHSDGADAWRTFAMARNRPGKAQHRRPAQKPRTPNRPQPIGADSGWMIG